MTNDQWFNKMREVIDEGQETHRADDTAHDELENSTIGATVECMMARTDMESYQLVGVLLTLAVKGIVRGTITNL